MHTFRLAAAALASLAVASVCRADTATYSVGGAGDTFAASAKFDYDSSTNTLKVTLTNTSTVATSDNAQVLSAVFFNTTSTLTPVSAALGSGSSFYWGSSSAGSTNLGGNYQYVGGSSDLTSAVGYNSGISGVGYTIAPGVFSQGNFGSPSENVDGQAYGLVSASTTSSTYDPNSNLLPDVKNSVVFTLTTSAGFSLSELGSQVRFQWGTALTDTHIDSPVPSSLVMLGTMLVPGLGAFWHRRRKSGVAT